MASVLLLAIVVTGCGGAAGSTPAATGPIAGATASMTDVPPTTAASPRPVQPSPTAPATSMSPAQSLDPGDPDRTLAPGTVIWPRDVIEAAVSLAILDASIQEAGSDLSTAAQDRDMHLFMGAASGLQQVVEQGMPSAGVLARYAATATVGAELEPRLTAIDTAARDLVASLSAGDAPGVQSATTALATAMQGYGAVRNDLAAVADQALLMRRSLLE